MKKALSRNKIRRMLLEEIQKIGEDTLVTKSDNTLGSSIRPGHTRHHDCPKCYATMDMCECGYMDESECSECNTQMYEYSDITNKDYSLNSMNSNSTPVDNLDYHNILRNMMGMHSGNMASKHSHSGAYMSKSQLYKVSKYAEKLYTMIPDGHNLEDWMRTKISQIADDIGEVYHALDHDNFEGDL